MTNEELTWKPSSPSSGWMNSKTSSHCPSRISCLKNRRSSLSSALIIPVSLSNDNCVIWSSLLWRNSSVIFRTSTSLRSRWIDDVGEEGMIVGFHKHKNTVLTKHLATESSRWMSKMNKVSFGFLWRTGSLRINSTGCGGYPGWVSSAEKKVQAKHAQYKFALHSTCKRMLKAKFES